MLLVPGQNPGRGVKQKKHHRAALEIVGDGLGMVQNQDRIVEKVLFSILSEMLLKDGKPEAVLRLTGEGGRRELMEVLREFVPKR